MPLKKNLKKAIITTKMNFKAVDWDVETRVKTLWSKSFEETVYKNQEKEGKKSSVGDWEIA